MGKSMVTGLQAISVFVTDLARAREFWEGLLGFEPAGEMPPGMLFKAGEVTIYLEPGRKARADEPGAAAEVAPALATESVKAAHEKLRAAGVRIVRDYQKFGDDFAFFQCADPDGNLVEFAGAP